MYTVMFDLDRMNKHELDERQVLCGICGDTKPGHQGKEKKKCDSSNVLRLHAAVTSFSDCFILGGLVLWAQDYQGGEILAQSHKLRRTNPLNANESHYFTSSA